MARISVARVVAVIAKLDTGKMQIGSGYLLDGARVLTAQHCTVDRETGRAATALSVVRASDGATDTVTVSEASPTLDVALLTCSHGSLWAAELPGGPVTFGKVDRAHTGQLNGCEAVGYPLWQGSQDGGYRDVAELHGFIRVLEGMESQRLVLRDRGLQGAGLTHAGGAVADAVGVAADHRSQWGGLSGAAVFHGGLLLGVIIEHHPRQGETALQIRPIEAIAAARDGATIRLAEALGIVAPGAIRRVVPISTGGDSVPSGSKQNIRAGQDAYAAARDMSVHIDKSTTINLSVKLAVRLGSPSDAFAFIEELAERTLRRMPPDATLEQAVTLAEQWVTRPGEVPPIQHITEVAGQESSACPAEGPSGKVATEAVSEHCLAVILQQNLTDADRYRMSVVLYRDGHDGVPVECDDDYVPLEEIQAKVGSLVPRHSRGRGTVLIEFAVPESLLGNDFDQWPLAGKPNVPVEEEFRLGEIYPVVVRDLDRMKPDPEMSKPRWRRLLTCDGPAHEAVYWATPQATTRFKPFRARLRGAETAGHVILALRPAQVSARTVHDMIRAGVAEGIPAAIWMRRQHAAKTSIEDDADYLEKAMVKGGLRSLPHQVQILRLIAAQEDGKAAHPGRRLSLLWADPRRSSDPPPFEQPALSANGDDL
jgi:hypothetical protein